MVLSRDEELRIVSQILRLEQAIPRLQKELSTALKTDLDGKLIGKAHDALNTNVTTRFELLRRLGIRRIAGLTVREHLVRFGLLGPRPAPRPKNKLARKLMEAKRKP